jgi:branched-chain amino acid transport system permease protein
LIGILIAWFITARLKRSRLGRAWMAVREDEDVAAAMSINLVGYKLLAFATGAGLAGLSGAMFGSKLGSMRSEERRVGEECAELCRSRWSPYH